MRWINDGANETISLSQNEFDLLSRVFNPDNMGIYNVLRSSFKDWYGYVDEDGNQVLAAAKVSEERAADSGWMDRGLGLSWNSAALDVSGEFFYSELLQQWRGKDLVPRGMYFNGNGYTGGRNRFAKTLSKRLKHGGRLLGIISTGYDLRSLLLSSNSEDALRASMDLLIDATGFVPGLSFSPLVWGLGGREYFYNVVLPGILEQQEMGVLGLPSNQPFK